MNGKNFEIREKETAQYLKKFLAEDGWKCIQDKAGQKGINAKGTDLIFKKDKELLGIEVKGDTESPSTDFKAGVGQTVFDLHEKEYTYNAICVTKKYERYVIEHSKTLKDLNILVYIVNEDGSVVRFFPDVL
ncbi:MAG: hypothetical protein ACTSQI_14210 [Candidatus Helarchaeota archaeon]